MPSAELKECTKGSNEMVYHDALLNKIRLGATKASLLFGVIAKKHFKMSWENGCSIIKLITEETFLQDLDWLLSTMKRNAFKRLQLPPCITLHAKTITGRISTQVDMQG